MKQKDWMLENLKEQTKNC